MMKKTLTALICIVITLSILPTVFCAKAASVIEVRDRTELEEGLKYAGTGDEFKLTGDILIDVKEVFTNGLDIISSVAIDLNGKTLEIISEKMNTNCIKIHEGKTLVIKDGKGTGQLIANNFEDTTLPGFGAGINSSAGRLEILGGHVIAESEMLAAAIGGGSYEASGKVIISGSSKVDATANGVGAGIGSGYGEDCDIEISGNAIVRAVGGSDSYGAGAGVGNGGFAYGGKVKIHGNAQVEALGGDSNQGGGAGIGAGQFGGNCEVTIAGSVSVVAIGGDGSSDILSGGAGIGNGGTSALLTDLTGKMIITGGNVQSIPGKFFDGTDLTEIADDENGELVKQVDIKIEDGEENPVSGVKIVIGKYEAYTDKEGSATIWIAQPEGKTISFSKPGYKNAAGKVIMDQEGKHNLAVQLETEAVVLPPVLVGDKTAVSRIAVNNTYTIDLDSKFKDENGNNLRYYVKIGEREFAETSETFAYVPKSAGTEILIFKANNGTYESDQFIVALTAFNALTISYDSGGGTGEMDSEDIEEGTDYTVKDNEFEKTGYKFIGWSIETEEEPGYMPDDIIEKVSKNITLYAQWEEAEEVLENSLTPDASVFDKTEGNGNYKDISAALTYIEEAKVIKITCGSTTLAEGKDYLKSGDKYTFVKEYISTLAVGTYKFVFDMDKGNKPELTIIVIQGLKWKNPFDDINTDDWFYKDVEYAVVAGLFNGVSANMFSPQTSMTRGMIVTVLGRLTEIKTEYYKGESFSDVDPAEYYAPYVKWAAERGIIKGVGENTFVPNGEISRQDLAVILHRYAELMRVRLPSNADEIIFLDEKEISDYAVGAVEDMQRAGIINGKQDGLFDPKGCATRAEVAAIMHRYCELIA